MLEQFALATSGLLVSHWHQIVQKLISPIPGGMRSDLGAPQLPGSKSHAQRALVLASFLASRTQMSGVPASADLSVLRAVMDARGVGIATSGADLVVQGVGARAGETVTCDAGENATTARMLLSMLPLLGCQILVDGHERLRRRPMTAATAMLRAAGVEVTADHLPITADGRALPTRPDFVRVDASVTTQPASGAMLAIALAGGGVVETVAPQAVGYLELTAQVLREFGGSVECDAQQGSLSWRLGPLQALERSFRVPSDPSARSFVAVLAAMHDLPCPPNLRPSTTDRHPEWQVDGDIAKLQAAGSSDLTFKNLSQRPDCVPALAALAALRPGRTTFAGLQNLRTKESDRLLALASALCAIGVQASVDGEDLEVRGPLPKNPGLVAVQTVPDHRIVMAMALLGTVLPGGVEIDQAEAVNKSWPGYWDWLGRCAAVR